MSFCLHKQLRLLMMYVVCFPESHTVGHNLIYNLCMSVSLSTLKHLSHLKTEFDAHAFKEIFKNWWFDLDLRPWLSLFLAFIFYRQMVCDTDSKIHRL